MLRPAYDKPEEYVNLLVGLCLPSFGRVGIRALLLGAQHFVHKGGQAIHRRLQGIDAPVERSAGGGLGFIKLGNVLQAVTHCHVRGNALGGVVGEDLFVVVGGHTGCSFCL